MTDNFSKGYTLQVKGAMVLLILSHHIYQNLCLDFGPWINYIFRSFGYLAVAVFFFISGYGITCSMRNGGGISRVFQGIGY